MTDLQEKAMRMALEALKKSHPISNSNEDLYAHSEAGSELYNELKKAKALAQPEQEPVGWMWERRYDNGGYTRKLLPCEYDARKYAEDGIGLPNQDIVLPVYTAPPKREWKGLTSDDKHFLLANAWNKEQAFDGFMEAIDKFLEEKNCG